MRSLLDIDFPSRLKKCLPEFLHRFFFGAETLRFRRRGDLDHAKRQIWSRLREPQDNEVPISGIILANSVHLCRQRQHPWNDFQPVFHEKLRIDGQHIILEGRISASQSSQMTTVTVLIALFCVAMVYAWTVFVPFCCSGMTLTILGTIKFCRRKAIINEKEIISTIQEIFPERLIESRARGS